MSDEQKRVAISNYVYWLCNNQPQIFFNFMMVWVKLILFINQISYEELTNRDEWAKLTEEIFEQEVELE